MGIYKNNSGTLDPIAGTPDARLAQLDQLETQLGNHTVAKDVPSNAVFTDTKTGDELTTKVAKTGSGSTVTTTISAGTTMDNAIGTLLNNDAALNNDLTALFDAEELASQALSTTEQILTISGIENYEFLLFEVRTQGLLRGSSLCIQRKPYEFLCLWNYSGTIYNTRITFGSSINKTISTGTAGNAGALYIYGVKKKHN